jgi:predicted amidohydrolase YtcJ
LGRGNPPSNLYSRNIESIDCGGGTIVPGFNDAHSHILSSASGLVSVDCSSGEITSISDICIKLRYRASLLPEDAWVRGAGYSDFDIREKRHPNRFDIDRWVPGHSVRLTHKSGHATVLNSRALGVLGINRETVDPSEGFN